MRKLLILITIVLGSIYGMAQNRHTITGSISDSITREPLELVTVALLQVKDSSLVSYVVTDKKGVFTLYNVKDNIPQRLLVSYVGYKSLRVKLNFPVGQLYNLGALSLSPKQLASVTVKGEAVPIIIKKDTIEFNAEAFKVRPNALVQDLLKKLPGMQVERDGTLMFNGKSISKVKVDGRDFFANNYRIVTQNLDADMIAKIQVYDDRENDPDHLLPDNDVKKIVNLKFKKEFTKSAFGKMAAGAGTQGRYQLDGTFIKTLDDLQVAIISNSNNLNGTNFTSPSFSPFQFGPRAGDQRLTTTGVNINDNFGKHVKVNLTYNLNAAKATNNSIKNVQQFLHDTTITSNSINTIHNTNTNHAINGTVDYTPDAATKWHFAPQISIVNNSANTGSVSTAFNNFTPILSHDVRTDNNSGSNTNYEHNLSYYHSFKKQGESINISNSVTINPSSGVDYNTDNLTSYIAGLNSDTLNRLANNASKNTSVNVDVSYHYPLSKNIIGGLTYTSLYNQTGASLFTYNQDLATGKYDLFLQSQSSDLTRNLWGENLHPQIIYTKKKVNLDAGFIVMQQNINNRFGNNVADLNQTFDYLLPVINLTLGKVTFSYSESVQQPSISDMQPITIVYSQLFSFKGNPDLKPVRRHMFNMRLFNFNYKSGSSTSVYAQVTQDNSSFTRQSTITPQGATFTTPINGKGRFSTSLSYSQNIRFKKMGQWTLSEHGGINVGYGHNYYLVNNLPGYQNTYYGSYNQGFSAEWNDIFSISPSYVISPAVTRYELVKLPTQSYARQEVTVPINIQWPKHIVVDINYNYIYNPQEAQGIRPKSNILSVSIARLLQQKDKGEFRLTCYDLLNQSLSSSHYAENNTINDIQYQTLKRYFMLSYSYRFNKVTSKGSR